MKKIYVLFIATMLAVMFAGCYESPTSPEHVHSAEQPPLISAADEDNANSIIEHEIPYETLTAIHDNYGNSDSDYEDGDNEEPLCINAETPHLIECELTLPMVALTFDDGPSRYTEGILDLLEYHGGRSTFFVSVPRMLERQSVVIRAYEMGNEIANHSLTHQNLTHLTESQIAHEIQAASNAIVSVVGLSPPMLRPPFGMSDDRVVQISYDMGYSIVKWTVDPLDWRYRNADIIYQHIMNHVEDGAIILVHDTHSTTAAAMEMVIPRLVEEGFQLVTVSELLYNLYGGLEPGRIFGTYTILD